MDKDDVILKVERLVNREVTVAKSIKYSSNHIDNFTGYKGILKSYDLGESYEDVIVSVEVVVSTGKKLEGRDNVLIWLDARDLVGVEK
jgi:hypothetical protein